jgi:hypothetical protein
MASGYASAASSVLMTRNFSKMFLRARPSLEFSHSQDPERKLVVTPDSKSLGRNPARLRTRYPYPLYVTRTFARMELCICRWTRLRQLIERIIAWLTTGACPSRHACRFQWVPGPETGSLGRRPEYCPVAAGRRSCSGSAAAEAPQWAYDPYTHTSTTCHTWICNHRYQRHQVYN